MQKNENFFGPYLTEEYPNWWASIPMPIASFLEEYDFTGKTLILFCSHGGGRFGQSLTAIAKLVPDAKMGEALSVHYSGGSSLSDDVEEWLRTNGMIEWAGYDSCEKGKVSWAEMIYFLIRNLKK